MKNRKAFPNTSSQYNLSNEVASFNELETINFIDHKTQLVSLRCRDNLQAKILSLDKPLLNERPMQFIVLK